MSSPVEPPPTDEELLGRAQGGDELAFAELRKRHVAFTFRRCMGILKDPAGAEDANQETWIKARAKIISCNRAFQGWVAEIARTTSIDEIRRRQRDDRAIEGVVDAEGDRVGISREPDPLESLLDAHEGERERRAATILLERVAQTLLRLSRNDPTSIAAFLLHIVADMKYDDIARLLGRKYHGATSAVFRAILRLRATLQRDDRPLEGDDGAAYGEMARLLGRKYPRAALPISRAIDKLRGILEPGHAVGHRTGNEDGHET